MLYVLAKMASDTPLLPSAAVVSAGHMGLTVGTVGAEEQGLTLVHFSAQLKGFSWDRAALRGC